MSYYIASILFSRKLQRINVSTVFRIKTPNVRGHATKKIKET